MHRALWSDALPVELQMTVTARVDRGGGSELVGTGGPRQMTIRCFVPDRPAAAAVPGSVVAARGVYRVMATDRDKSRPLPDAIDLWADSAADVWMVRQPPWWGRPDVVKPLAATLAVCLAAAFGTGAWVLLLRRQVRAQSVQLATEIRSRRDAALEFEATLRERNRLAANLHDTLLQTLGGIGYQLDACEGSRARDESEAKVHFDVARRMVNHASNELHSAVWAMRSLPIRDQSFPRAVRTLCDRVGEGHAARIDVATEGDLEELPEFVAGNVLLVVQEAVLNALRHGQAARIDVRVADRPAAEAIDVEVRDDGRGFDAARRRGLDEGHFGIQGMHERAERLGGTLQIESVPGRGTLVRARVRRREFDAELAGAAPGA
jgi:signal transduction histidine kinase